MSHESINQSEFAEENELRQVFDAMNNWLVLHGQKTETESIKTTDPSTGLTIYSGHDKSEMYDDERYEYNMPIDMLQQIAPEARRTLQIGGRLMFWYAPAHFEYDFSISQPRFHEPECGVFYKMDETSAYDENSLSITLRGDIDAPEAIGEKRNYSPREGRLKLRDFNPEDAEVMFGNMMENLGLEHDLGADRMTKAECAALADILNGLLA